MNRFFAFFLSFCLLIFGQQSLFAKAAFEKEVNTTETEETHQHGHSFGIALKMILTGMTEHDHEHDHDEDLPWTDTHSPATKTHSHFDGHALKLDVVASKSIPYVVFVNTNTFKSFHPKSHHFELPSRIFRPPIFA